MPLRDHFRTTSTFLNWKALYGIWPATIVASLNTILPEEYFAQPRIRLGTTMEIDVGALERESSDQTRGPEPDEYEVNIYTQNEFRLVAAIELVIPSNKDRPENRQTFVNKCEALLKKDVCVTIVDPVTDRTGNLYGELLDELDAPRTAISRSGIYAATCRGRRNGPRWSSIAGRRSKLTSCWELELAVGALLPTLPIWVSPDRSFQLELEATYEEACRSLRIR